MPQTRIILHADMDAFFASVEQRDNPELRGRAVIVGGSSRRLPAGEKWVVARRYPPNTRGVVTTASYEARKFGVRSAMPMAQACRLAPDALVVPGRMHVYADTSRRIMEVLRTITPDVQPISIDEAFADITGSAHLFGGPEGAARELKRRVREAVNLTISVGVSCNKFLAKVASDMHKPDGLTVIEADAAPDLLAPMPVSVIPGVGPKAGQELARLGVRTILDLRRAAAREEDLRRLEQRLGGVVREWVRMAHGHDDREVHPRERAKSIGKERTFGSDIGDGDELRRLLLGFVEETARSLREEGLLADGLTLKLRTGDFTTRSRSTTFSGPTDRTADLWAGAKALLEAWLSTSPPPLRLLGVSLHVHQEGTQLELFGGDAPQPQEPGPGRRRGVDAAADAIVQRFGEGAIRRAGSMGERPGEASPHKGLRKPGRA